MTTPDIQHIHRASRIIAEQTGDYNIHDAEDYLHHLQLQVIVSASVHTSAVFQAALLTIVNAAGRTFLGGVKVIGLGNAQVCTPLANERLLADAVTSWGGELQVGSQEGLPTILLGRDGHYPLNTAIAVRVQVQGWKAAVIPAGDDAVLNDFSTVPLAGIFGAALAVSEVFAACLRLHAEAGQRQLGISLWEPEFVADWRTAADGPEVKYLPSSLSVIGLGHLGQAYLWALASLPYRSPAEVEFVLHDRDIVAAENLSTCLLIDAGALSFSKARSVASWLEARGFRTRMIERRFQAHDHWRSDDPSLVLVGVDSPRSREEIAVAIATSKGPAQLLDMGLGASVLDFDEIVLHASPFSDDDLERWRQAESRNVIRIERAMNDARLQSLCEASGLDACGIVRLAGLAVGVPYVGAAAGALMVAEVLRRLAGHPPMRALSIRLRDLELRHSPQWHNTGAIPIAFTDARPGGRGFGDSR